LTKQLVRYVARHHLALLALFLALGGTSYAAMRLPANSVTTREVKNHSLLGKDLKRGQLVGARGRRGSPGPRGETGSKGATGAQGQKGTTGPSGQLAPAEAWKAPSLGYHDCSVFPPINGYWANYGNGFAPAGYYKDALGIVHLRGVVEGQGTDGCVPAVIFYLPQADWPAKNLIFAVSRHTTSDDVSRVDVVPDGSVIVRADVGHTYRYSLDGIAFRAGG